MSNRILLERTYGSPKAAIVQPERQIPVTAYNIDQWLPRLGVQRWALVQVLRRLALDAPQAADGTRQLEITRDDLARRLGIEWAGTVSEWLKSEPIPERKGWRRIIAVDEASLALAHFIPRLRYTYTRGEDGKTRRTGLALYIRMDEPLTPEDEARLPEVAAALIQEQMAQARLEGAREEEKVSDPVPEPQSVKLENPTLRSSVKSDFPISRGVKSENPTLRFSVKSDFPTSRSSVKSENPTSHSSVKSENPTSRSSVKSDFPTSRGGVKLENPTSRGVKSDFPTVTLTNERYIFSKIERLIQTINVTLTDGRRIRGQLTPIVKATEEALADYHSTQMLYKVLMALYRANRLDLFLQALDVAVEVGEMDTSANRGAVFVSEIKRLGQEEGVPVGLASSASQPSASGARDRRTGRGDGETAFVSRRRNEPGGTAVPEFLIPGCPDSRRLWESALKDLALQMTQATFDAWLRGSWVVGYEPPADGAGEEQFIVQVKNVYAVDWLTHRLAPTIVKTLSRLVGRPVQVKFRAAADKEA